NVPASRNHFREAGTLSEYFYLKRSDDVDVDVEITAHRLELGRHVPGHGVDVVGAEPGEELLGAGVERCEGVRPLERGLAGQPVGGGRVELAELAVQQVHAVPAGLAGQPGERHLTSRGDVVHRRAAGREVQHLRV